MRNGSEKNRMFAEQFRKKDRQRKKSELRSKFLKKEAQAMECQSQIHILIANKIFREKLEWMQHNQDSNVTKFAIIKKVLFSVHENFVQQRLDNSKQYQGSIIERLLIADQDSSLTINLHIDNQTQCLHLTKAEFLQLLRQLPGEIYKIVASTNQNIRIYKDLMSNRVWNNKGALTSQQNIAIAESFRYNSLMKIKEGYQLRVIGQYCRQYLEVFYEMSENIEFQHRSSEVMALITDCLIQITAFRPQTLKLSAYQVSLKPLVLQINAQMQQLRLFINSQLYKSLLPIVYNLSFSQHKLLRNYIHLIGNVMINVQQVMLNQSLELQKINHFLLTKFKGITSHLRSFLQQQQAQRHQEIKEMSFLMVWFLRNQLIILENYHMFDQSKSTPDSYQKTVHSVNDLWFPILQNSLQIMLSITQAFPDDEQGFKSIHSNIMSALDLIKVLFNEFTINHSNFQILVRYLQKLQDYIETSSLNVQADFLNKIYDLYFNLLCNCQDQEKLYKLIVEKACQGLKSGPKYPKAMKLCAKILNPYNKINYESKQQVFHIFSQNCDSFLQQLQTSSTLYIQRLSMLQLYYQAVLQSQNLRTRSEMISDILNAQRIGKILELCSSIWQQQGSVGDLTMGLQLLRELCDRQQYNSLLKYKIETVGYYEQLEILSSHTNDTINRLVYQIYELLQIM